MQAYALEVILNPYAGLEDEITAYDLTGERTRKDCECEEKEPSYFDY